MYSRSADRVLTAAVTATLTSAFWIVAGGSLTDLARDRSGVDGAAPTAAASSAAGATPAPGHGSATHHAAKEAGELVIPVAGVRAGDLSDNFNDHRGGGSRLHEALDIMAPEGATVVAAAPGTVEKLFFSDAGGNTIYVRSKDRQTIYYYAHLKDYAEGLKEGEQVRRGQRLGSVGHSGNASAEAPHLHFALMRTTADADWWEPATALNPYPLLSKPGR